MITKTEITEITQLDRQLAVPMFLVAFVFLVLAGFLLPTLLYRDIEQVDLPHAATSTPIVGDLYHSQTPSEMAEEIIYFVPQFRIALTICLCGLYLALVIEAVAHWLTGAKNLRQHFLFLLIPFMRLSTRDHITGSNVWIIGRGWCKSSLILEKQLAGAFSVPMVAMALPILPLIIVQLIWPKQVSSNPDLKFLMATGTALIWIAFVFEFAVMFTASRRKLKYCKEHWINILIVALPMLGFMRLAALSSFFKLQQLAKTVSVLRLRGLAIRLWRGTISLGIIDKALRKTPDHKIEKLDRMIAEKQEDLELLQWERDRALEKKEQLATAQRDLRKKPAPNEIILPPRGSKLPGADLASELQIKNFSDDKRE